MIGREAPSSRRSCWAGRRANTRGPVRQDADVGARQPRGHLALGHRVDEDHVVQAATGRVLHQALLLVAAAHQHDARPRHIAQQLGGVEQRAQRAVGAVRAHVHGHDGVVGDARVAGCGVPPAFQVHPLVISSIFPRRQRPGDLAVADALGEGDDAVGAPVAEALIAGPGDRLAAFTRPISKAESGHSRAPQHENGARRSFAMAAAAAADGQRRRRGQDTLGRAPPLPATAATARRAVLRCASADPPYPAWSR